MNKERIETLRDTYRDGLLDDTVPFWLRHAPDPEYGGIFTALDRDGAVIDTDKPVWPQGRFAWLMATLYNAVEQREEWLATAQNCVTFLEEHAFDADGRMFFLLTREGEPLRKRRYVYSECFAAMAFAATARATGDDRLANRAIDCARAFVTLTSTPGLLEPKTNPETRPTMGMGPHMIRINLAQTLRETIGFTEADAWIVESIETITRHFMKPELEAVLEVVGPDGELRDHFDGRTLNPGHAIEAAWFILHEAKLRGNDPELIRIGTTIIDWMWKRGWDEEHGGIFYFRDVKHLPVQEYWHDMKFWWPHNETIIATLLAYSLTGDAKYAEWHKMVHDWSYAHFPDAEHGEWFGYLHRDGRISTSLKGNHWKGPFHLPRMQWYCWRLCEEMLARDEGAQPLQG